MSIKEVVPVSKAAFLAVFGEARAASDKIHNATSTVHEVSEYTDWADGFCLDSNGRYGFCVKRDGELVALFSMVRRAGDELVQQAVERGAEYLSCFDGYLPGFYVRNGFTEIGREANWTPGEPDVIFMAYNGSM